MKRVSPIAIAVGALALLLALTAGPDPGATPTVTEVSRRVMSPFCPGLTLDECPSSQAAELRIKITERVRAGDNNRQIDRWVVAEYGEGALARPRSSFVWAAPAALLIAGIGALGLVLNRKAKLSNPPEPQQLPPEVQERISEELAAFAKGTE